MKSFKNYLHKFLHGEDASEIVEWCIIVSIVAILAGAAFAVVRVVYNQIQRAGDSISNLDYNSIGGNGGDAGGATPTTPVGGGTD